MHSSPKRSPHRGSPVKGAPPLFSRRWLSKTVIVVIIAALVIIPVFQLYPNRAQGANPTYSVTIVDYGFQPSKINITTGTMVVWTYVSSGKDYHTVTSDPGTNTTQSGTPLLNSGTMSPGQTFSYTFDRPGHYPYQCSFHPTIMNAWVNVTGSPVTPSPSQTPPDYSIVGIAGGIVGVVVLATVALFFRKKRRTSVPHISAQSK